MSTFPRQKRLNWHGHIGREEDNLSRKMMDMDVPGKRRRGWPRRRCVDNNQGDMNKYELIADMTENRQYWKMMKKTGKKKMKLITLCVDPPELFANLTDDCHPIASKSRRYSFDDRKFIENETQRLLRE